MQNIKVTVQVFSRFRDAVGKSEVDISLTDGSTIKCLLERMRNLYGEEFEKCIGKDGSLQVILLLNGKVARIDHKLKNGDIIALMPPVAGG